jgi:CHAT domain-containing protein
LKRISREWYQWLLSNVDIHNELVIIPHGRLSLISFEMLDANEKGRNVDYVIEKHPVRYELSANLMFGGFHSKGKQSLKPFGGFAASASSLPGTAEEVKSIADIMNGDAYINAAPVTFLNNAGNYQVLHIATHANADEGAFHECNFLFDADSAGNNTVRDVQIASLKLNARLTTLSACTTGLGKLHNSEGMLSPVRSFFIAGCPSVVMNLWAVNDASTLKIMAAFYSHLKKGETKSVALQHAKLDYLENETNPAKKHPYYWAGFIVVGDNAPLPAADFLREHWGMIVIAIAILFSALLYFRIRPDKSAA